MNILQFLKSTCAKFIELLPTLSFDKNNLYHQYVIGLYCKMIELAANCHVLAEKKMATGIPILFRAYLEAYVDLKNLFKDKSYVNFLEAKCLTERLKVYEQARKKDNPYLQRILKIKNLNEEQTNDKRQLEHLREKGFQPLQIRERFEKAGMLSEYYSLYNSLCCHAHNNKRSLIARHVKITNGDFQFVIFKDSTILYTGSYLLTLCDYLIEVSSEIHRLLESPSQTDFDKLKARSGELLKELGSE